MFPFACDVYISVLSATFVAVRLDRSLVHSGSPSVTAFEYSIVVSPVDAFVVAAVVRLKYADGSVQMVRTDGMWYASFDTPFLRAGIYEGETLGLVGESGCGKTTLGRSMLRLIEPTSGNVFYQGKDIVGLPVSEMRKLRKDLQIILQDPYSSLNQRLTIGEALMEPMKVHGILQNDKARKNKVIELLERVSLNESHFYRYPHEFSGGQRQRISIARALAVNPRFIICDESVSALDVSVQAQVLNLLNELKAEYHFTYIFISHDLSVVKFMADRIAVMQQGVIVESGEADALCANPQTEYTKKLIDSIPKGIVG